MRSPTNNSRPLERERETIRSRISSLEKRTAAAIDRLVHHSVILEFDVSSYRTEDARKRANEKSDGKEKEEEKPKKKSK